MEREEVGWRVMDIFEGLLWEVCRRVILNAEFWDKW
jgi:hypothetical protein